ncbi:MAG: vanadium-dependent haloperoxidase [Saprospiraceae bacterium]|nr:vanadium-dependent haloperoxidase [Saprospiraceae bacterium]
MPLLRYLIISVSIWCLTQACKPDLKQSALSDQSKNEQAPEAKKSIAYQWAEIALKATARDTERFRPRPSVTSRYLALLFVAMFDAWSRYDEKALPVYLQGIERRPVAEQNGRNKEIAVSYAAYRTLSEYYFSDSLMFSEFMVSIGLNPSNASLDPSTPEGIGNLAAKAVIDARTHDGSNQYAEKEGSEGLAYFDYTKYAPVNTDDTLADVNRWQPKYFIPAHGKRFAPGCLTPQWGNVRPVALRSSDQFRSPPPPMVGSKQLEQEVKEVVNLQANLTNEQKALVEFMRDGPASVQQAGHWLKFAMNVSVRDSQTLDEDVKMFMLTEVTAMDAFIACWDTKMFYDFARPYALVHHYFKDKQISGWAGPEKGWTQFPGQEWRPYSPDDFLCPPFPGYVSGHSTVSGGCAEVLRLFTGDDYFGEEIKWVPGYLTEPKNVGDTVILKFPTFTETANMAGQSRVLGGYHIQADNVEGLVLGRKVGNEVWKWYLEKVKSEE